MSSCDCFTPLQKGGKCVSFSFINQMEENTKFNLCYPYHIHKDKMLKPETLNPIFADSLHTHSFELLLKRAYQEPFAFYLTDEDRQAYSNQELEFIARILTFEKERINNGYEIIDFDLEPDTLNALLEYKNKNNMTFEEAVLDVLQKIVNNINKTQ